MGLLDTVRSGIALASTLTADLQTSVAYEVFLEDDGSGSRTYAAAVQIPALVTRKQRVIKSLSGELVASQAEVVLLDPTVRVGEFDRITLPDGTTGPILNTAGFVDRDTGLPVLTEVYLG